MFQHLDAYPGDPILSLNEAFQKDPREHKVNLSIGIYFDDAGRIPVLACVRQAEAQMLAESAPKPYLPIEGSAATRAAVQRLLFGANHEAIRSGRIATLQTVGSSGGLKVGADFIKRWLPGSGVWVSDPTWDNHRAMFEGAGVVVNTYPYYDPATGDLAFDAMLQALRTLPARSVVLLHACCHNPTGVDLSRSQWQRLITVLRERELLPYLDLAYQGYGDGIEDDAFAVRELAASGLVFFVANSFSKSMSVYGERAGALSVVCADAAEAELVLGQMKATVRRNYSSPAIHAAGIVSRVLGDPALRAGWEKDVEAMRQRIATMRRSLHG
ncbi:MAG: aspartate/tyrosine/aromatic aminotransferase, partial [Chitinophagaceae bacterium]|nr:aspartate/tyrosine/aromatic aminotransferase [Rubrivivax sp.]